MKQASHIARAVCSLICRSNGIKAREIARELKVERSMVNHILYTSPLMRELCYQDRDYRWHGIVRQEFPHAGLSEFAGYYSLVRDFLAQSEEAWLQQLSDGCRNIGRNLNDTRGLIHSFRDSRQQMLLLFQDLIEMLGTACLDWEIVFELRLKRTRHVRIYADVLVITRQQVFSLEFKMKDEIQPEELQQAAKYTPFLEILFGPGYEILPVLVLTRAQDLFTYQPAGIADYELPVCSGDMLFNVFDAYLGFLQE